MSRNGEAISRHSHWKRRHADRDVRRHLVLVGGYLAHKGGLVWSTEKARREARRGCRERAKAGRQGGFCC